MRSRFSERRARRVAATLEGKLALVKLSTAASLHVLVETYREHYRELVALATARIGSRAAAEEVLLNAFIRAVYNADQCAAASAVDLFYHLLGEAIVALRRPSGDVVSSCNIAPPSPARVRRSPLRRYLRPRLWYRRGGRRGGRSLARPLPTLTAR
jgi:hypothetical protein